MYGVWLYDGNVAWHNNYCLYKLLGEAMKNPSKPTQTASDVMDEIDKAAVKAMKLTNFCTKHSLYHGQKYKSCTPKERVMIEFKPKAQKENV